MLVGEAPGADEERTGKPFVGAAGRVLNEALSAAGLTRDDVYISNSVRCRPPSNRTPRASEISACLPYLLEEIEERKPRVVVALGGTALKVFTGKTSITKERGKLLVSKIDTGAAVMATFHPAAALYEDARGVREALTTDLRRAKALAADQTADHELSIALPGESASERIRALSAAPFVSVDLEWTAGQTERDMIWPWSKRGEVYSISLTGRLGDVYTTVALAVPLVDEETRSALADVLRSRPIIFHNAIADLLWIAFLGYRGVRFSGDTMVIGHLLDETQPLGLEPLATRYGGIAPGWKGVLYQERPRTQEEWERLLTYNARDTYATAKLWDGQVATIKALAPERAAAIKRLHSILMVPAIKALTQAVYAGVPVNESELRRNVGEALDRRNLAAEKLADVVSLTPLAAAKLAASPDQTTAYMRGKLNIEVDNSQADTLAEYVLDYPAIEYILEWRKEHKLVSTYLEPWLTLLDRQKDGRLHSIYKPTGTRTGRTSAEGEKGGTLQTAPRAKWVRRMIEAAIGRMIVGGDFSQIELRAIAWIAQEPTMIALYREGDDLHRATAAFIVASGELGHPPALAEFWKTRHEWYTRVDAEKRQGAKGANFGLAYGMAWEKFRKYAKTEYGVTLTPDEAKTMHASYFRLYSRLQPWHEEIMGFARRHGFVTTPFGRQLSIPENNIHVALNTPIQSTASDFTLLTMGVVLERIRQEKLRALVIGNIHDAILLDVHEDDAERAGVLLKDTMENLDTRPFGFTIPIPLVGDIKVGRSWAE